MGVAVAFPFLPTTTLPLCTYSALPSRVAGREPGAGFTENGSPVPKLRQVRTCAKSLSDNYFLKYTGEFHFSWGLVGVEYVAPWERG